MLWKPLALLILLSLACPGCATLDGVMAYGDVGWELAWSKQAPPARMVMHRGVAVVHLYGAPREMGAQYGTLLGRALRAEHRCLRAFLSAETRAFYLRYAREHEPDLPPAIREELQAMADAARVPYEELVALNIIPRAACSGLAVWNPHPDPGDDTGMIMGRNADYFSMGFTDRGALVVVRHPGDGRLATACVSFLGMAGGFTGLNARGVAFGNMLVFNAPGERTALVFPPAGNGAVTIQLAMRLAAEHAVSADACIADLAGQRHLIPMIVMVADPTTARVLELTPDDHAVLTSDQGYMACSNYFHSALRTQDQVCPRYDSLLAAGASHAPAMSVAQMKRALYAARMPGLNLQAVILEPAARRIQVSINRIPASRGPYVKLNGNDLFDAPALGEPR